MKTSLSIKPRYIFMSSIIKQSEDDLPLTRRERTMVKWFLKFNTTLVLITLAWYMPVKALQSHLYEYKNLKAQVVDMSVQIPEAQASSSFQAILKSGDSTREDELPVHDKGVEEQYNYLLETDQSFKRYIDNMSVRRNNPGNLVFANQPGATKSGRFASFPDSRTGFRALLKQLELDASRGDTITTFYNDFAPAKENNTKDLIAGAITDLDITKDTKLKDINLIALAKYITFREHSYK